MASPQSNSEYAGGMASLQVAEAHLTTLLDASEGLDGRAMFIVALNVALFGVFFGVVASLEWSWAAIGAPGAIAATICALGWQTVRPRRIAQFPEPTELLKFSEQGQSDEQLAWLYVQSIEDAAEALGGIAGMKEKYVIRLAVCSAAHVIALVVSVTVWSGV